MIKLSNNILDNKTYKKLKKICEDFDNRDFNNVNYETDNYYVRLFVKQNIFSEYVSEY